MCDVTEMIRRINSSKFTRGDYIGLAIYEIKLRTNSSSFADELRQIFEAFYADKSLVQAIIALKVVKTAEMKKYLSTIFNFDPAICECAAQHYVEDESFIKWLMPHIVQKSRSVARCTFGTIAKNLSYETLWSIEKNARDQKISAIASREVKKRIDKKPELLCLVAA